MLLLTICCKLDSVAHLNKYEASGHHLWMGAAEVYSTWIPEVSSVMRLISFHSILSHIFYGTYGLLSLRWSCSEHWHDFQQAEKSWQDFPGFCWSQGLNLQVNTCRHRIFFWKNPWQYTQWRKSCAWVSCCGCLQGTSFPELVFKTWTLGAKLPLFLKCSRCICLSLEPFGKDMACATSGLSLWARSKCLAIFPTPNLQSKQYCFLLYILDPFSFLGTARIVKELSVVQSSVEDELSGRCCFEFSKNPSVSLPLSFDESPWVESSLVLGMYPSPLSAEVVSKIKLKFVLHLETEKKWILTLISFCFCNVFSHIFYFLLTCMLLVLRSLGTKSWSCSVELTSELIVMV